MLQVSVAKTQNKMHTYSQITIFMYFTQRFKIVYSNAWRQSVRPIHVAFTEKNNTVCCGCRVYRYSPIHANVTCTEATFFLLFKYLNAKYFRPDLETVKFFKSIFFLNDGPVSQDVSKRRSPQAVAVTTSGLKPVLQIILRTPNSHRTTFVTSIKSWFDRSHPVVRFNIHKVVYQVTTQHQYM
jgi:hypothetical protein